MAQTTDAQKRRLMLPNIKAATDCVAKAALNHASIVFSYRFSNIEAVIADAWKQCIPQLQTIAAQHDYLHGEGTGISFVTGPYRNDLARAVLVRIKPELDARVAAQDRAEAAERTAKAQQELDQKEAIERLTRTARTIRDLFYECSTQQLRRLVRSAKGADVLATAAMTICRKELDDAVAGWIAVGRAEGTIGNEPTFREGLLKVTRESVLTTAVQLKANTLPVEPPPTPTAQSQMATEGTGLQTCLVAMAKAREGKMIEQRVLLEGMLELCRPEIETIARAAYLNTNGADLAAERQKTLLAASVAAKKLIGMAD